MIIEEIHIKNFKSLKDVHLKNLPAMAVFIGENGSGKSSLFRVFSFLRDCLTKDVRYALQKEGGLKGFREVLTRGVALSQNICIEIRFQKKSAEGAALVRYAIEIGLDENKPAVMREILALAPASEEDFTPLISFELGKGIAINNEEDFVKRAAKLDMQIQSIAPDTLAIASLGLLERFQTAGAIRALIAGWDVSDFKAEEMRGKKMRGDGERLSGSGGNLASVAYRLQEEEPDVFRKISETMRQNLPGVGDIAVELWPDGSVNIRIAEQAFGDAFLDYNVSDGTMRLFAYLVMLHESATRRFLIVEEPENQLHHGLMTWLAEEFQGYAYPIGNEGGGQVFVSSHSPDFLNAVELESLFILEKNDGITRIFRAKEDPLQVGFIREGELPGTLWQQGLFAGISHRIETNP